LDDRPPFTLLDALVHRHRVILGIAAAFCLAAAALSLVMPKTYEATAIIYLDTARTASDFDAGIAAGDLVQHDFIVSATSRPTLLEACAGAGVTCWPSDLVAPETTIGKLVTAAVFRGTSEVAVTAKGRTPAEAAALANAVAQATIDQDAAEVRRLYQPARANLNSQLAQLASQMDAERKALADSAPASSAAAAHTAELNRLQSAYTLTLTRLMDLNQRQDRLTNVATIVQPALPPTKPESPDPLLYVGAALVAGLCVGVFAALLIERLDDRIVSAEGLARAASIPRAYVTQDVQRLLFPRTKSSYSRALANLMARSPHALRKVLVVAASGRDHSDPVAAGLGTVAATAGQRVTVMEFDGHANGSPRPFRSEVAGLTVIAMPTALSESPAGVSRLRGLDGVQDGEFVLMSVPSPDVSPAALALGRSIQQSVLVATHGMTRFGDARRTADLLRQSGIDVVAGILLKN
jgi:capsular polysaccharide biosynthesis protein